MRRTTTIIETDRLVLSPLQIGDATTMAEVLGDRTLYEFTGGEPPTVEELTTRYRAQIAGAPDPTETWHNWIVRRSASRASIGFVQATVVADGADVAWVIGVPWQGEGIASEAATAMCRWLRDSGVVRISAHIHPDHAASSAVAKACGLRPTSTIGDDGERLWAIA